MRVHIWSCYDTLSHSVGASAFVQGSEESHRCRESMSSQSRGVCLGLEAGGSVPRHAGRGMGLVVLTGRVGLVVLTGRVCLKMLAWKLCLVMVA